MKYEEILDKVREGKKVKIDLNKKTVKVNKKVVFDSSANPKTDSLLSQELQSHPWETAELLYEAYKTSVPSKKDEYAKSFFMAKRVEDLTMKELVQGKNRREAQAALELYLLFGGVLNIFPWKEEKHWFYQGMDPEFIVLKDWVA